MCKIKNVYGSQSEPCAIISNGPYHDRIWVHERDVFLCISEFGLSRMGYQGKKLAQKQFVTIDPTWLSGSKKLTIRKEDAGTRWQSVLERKLSFFPAEWNVKQASVPVNFIITWPTGWHLPRDNRKSSTDQTETVVLRHQSRGEWKKTRLGRCMHVRPPMQRHWTKYTVCTT